MKDSFILYNSFYESIQALSIKDKAILLDMIFQYNSTGETPDISSVSLKVIWPILRQQFDRDNLKYQNVVERNHRNGSKGGRPKNQENPVGFLGNPESPKKADNDSDTVSDTVSVSDTENGSEPENKRIRFSPPSLDEVTVYVAENKFSVNAQSFVDFYISNGWKVGTNKMKDWRAAVRNWDKRNKESKISHSHPANELINNDYSEQLKNF